VKSLCDDYLAEKMLKKDVVSSPEAVKNYLKLKVSGLKDEVFMVIYLDTKNQVISSEIMHKGTVDETAVYPRNILKRALELHASGMILVHNHPSGFSSPSDDDIRLTNAIREVVRTLNLRLLDHMVIAKDGCFSFVEQGML
jgi:DNA repair protein RadC